MVELKVRSFRSAAAVLLLAFVLGNCGGHPYSEGDTDHPAPPPSLTPRQDGKEYEDKHHWFNQASASTTTKLRIRPIETKAKNLIMFLGDGLSLSTVTASRIYKGQTEGADFGEEATLHMDTFPFLGTSKTFCSDWQVADSACSATSYLCGAKGNAHTLGVTPSVNLGNCTAQMNPDNQLSSILHWAQAAGMSTGVVTTAGVTHASPAASYAHSGHREWETDKKVRDAGWDPSWCDDIAEQLVLQEPGSKIDVILGGGRENFYNSTEPDVEFPEQFGGRTDGKNLVTEWMSRKTDDGLTARYITGRDQLLNLNVAQTDAVLGLFAMYHMEYKNEQEQFNDPSLAEMTDLAIRILSKNPNGYFLFVEGGRIDHAHHGNWPKRALIETVEFDKAIQLADSQTSDDDTLIVVTADHSHLFTIAGDPVRGNPILALSGNTDNEDGLPHATLNYVNGPGYRPPAISPDNPTHCPRVDVSDDPVGTDTFRYLSMVPRGSATHAGEDVLIHAKGPWAHLLTGTNDQSYIPHAMAFAACINPYGENSCDGYNDNDQGSSTSAPPETTCPGAANGQLALNAFVALVLVLVQMFTFKS